MDWADGPQHARLREAVRRVIADEFPASYRPDATIEQSLEPEDVFGYHWAADRRSDDPERRQAVAEWTHRLSRRGWVAPHWPEQYGGAGLGDLDHCVFTEEMARAGVPTAGGIGVSLVGPTLIAHGSEAQRRQHLPPILEGRVAWAQAFSEPSAGSDLAGLATTARREGDCFIVDGQKIWTSAAQFADWICVLARSDPEPGRHRGLTFLLVDAHSPGVTVRPIEDMTGARPFNEVFFDRVRVPASQVVGQEGRGWYVAMAMLDFERSGIGGVVNLERAVARLVRAARGARGGVPDALRLHIADRHVEVEVARQFALRTVSMQAAGETPQREASVNQLFRAELHQRVAGTAVKAAGLHGLLRGGRGDHEPAPADEHVRAVPATLLSGTSEVQRNVIATRGLGLPRG